MQRERESHNVTQVKGENPLGERSGREGGGYFLKRRTRTWEFQLLSVRLVDQTEAKSGSRTRGGGNSVQLWNRLKG